MIKVLISFSHALIIGSLLYVSINQTKAQPLPSIIQLEALDNPGLSQVTVTSMVQDSIGFLWIATRDGLNRFDGSNFKTYYHNKNDSTSIQGNILYDLEYKSNKLWIASSDGIRWFDQSRNIFINYPIEGTKELSSEALVRKIEVIGTEILVATTHGLFTLDINSGKYYMDNKFTFLKGINIKALLRDSKGNNWIGTSEGIYQDNNSTLTYTKLSAINHLYEDPSSGSIYASAQDGLYKSENGEPFQKIIFPLVQKIEIYCVTRSQDGNLWASTYISRDRSLEP